MSDLPLRPDIKEALDGWADGSMPFPGGFVTAVLENNLKEAFVRADDYNLDSMKAIVTYCYSRLPSTCWGSAEAVREWGMMLKKIRDGGAGT